VQVRRFLNGEIE